MKKVSAWLGLCLTAAVGCSSGGGSAPPSTSDTDCSTGVPKFAAVTMFKKCTMCHSSTLSGAARKAAPPTINFDTYAAASGNAMAALDIVMADQMPPPGSGVTVTDAEKQTFYHWAMCGSPQ